MLQHPFGHSRTVASNRMRLECMPFFTFAAMQKLLLAWFSLFATVVFAADEPKVLFSVYLIGDTGKDTIPSEVLFLLAYEALDKTNSAVVFLGDNVYPAGNSSVSGGREKIERRILESQLELFSTYPGQFYMIPGNHDWANGKGKGLQAVQRQKALADTFSRNSTLISNSGQIYFPSAGLPGPVSIAIDSVFQLILIDTQWWLHKGVFRTVRGSGNRSYSEEKRLFLAALDSAISKARSQGRVPIVAGHHPLISNGQHAHRKEPLRFLFNYTPLALFQILGLDRWLSQDLFQPRYRRFRKAVQQVFDKHERVIYAAGHEHNLQLFQVGANYQIVSGSGSKLSYTDRYRYPALFMEDRQHGFFKLDILSNGAVRISAYGVRDRGEYWVKTLFQLPLPAEN